VYTLPLHDALPIFALSHGLALDLDGIGIVDESVTDGISQGRVVQVFMPLAGVILGTENGGGHLVSGLYQFQHIPRLCLLEGVEQPLVQHKQLLFPELFHVVPVGSVSPGYDKIGLLPPAAYTDAGYRLYNEQSLEHLHQILLYRELEFPLSKIKAIMASEDFDRYEVLDQQIEMLKAKKAHLE